MARRLIKTSARTLFRTDWAAVRWFVPGRIALAATIVVAVAIATQDVTDAIPLSLGLLFTGIGDTRGVFTLRLRGMLLAAVGMAIATELGLLVAARPALHIAMAVLVALVCGFVGIAGPRAALAGMLSLVMFAVYSGTPEPLGEAVHTSTLVLLGGFITIAVVLLPLLFRRMGGVRTDLAIAYRALGFAVRYDPQWQRAAGPAAKLAIAREHIAEAQPRAATETWYTTLTDGVEHIRLAVFALQAERHGDVAEPIGRVESAVAGFVLAAAAAIELEPRRGRVPRAASELESALELARSELPGRIHGVLTIIAAEAERITTVLAEPYPFGRAARFHVAKIPSREGLRRLLRWEDSGDVYLRHAIRLAIVMGVATAITDWWSQPHDYWFPMTVAWVMKPGYAATMPRLMARVSGVVLGVAGTVLVLSLTGGGPGVLIIGMGVAGLLFSAFIVTNYTVATIGITAFVVTILYAESDPVADTAPAQVLCAIAAGVLAAIATRLWPARTTARIAADLAGFARALGVYAASLHGPSGADIGERTAARRAVAAARTRASTMITAAQNEPGGHTIAAGSAATILRDLNDAVAIAVAVELGIHDELPDGIDVLAVASLTELATRLESVHDAGRCEAASQSARDAASPTVPRFDWLIGNAHLQLDSAATMSPVTGGMLRA